MKDRYSVEKLENEDWIVFDHEKNECVAKCSTRERARMRVHYLRALGNKNDR